MSPDAGNGAGVASDERNPPPPDDRDAPHDYVPPGSDLERSLLGACLLDHAQVQHLRGLSPLFGFPNRLIAEVVLDLDSEGVAPDLRAVAHRLRESDQLAEVGGEVYLAGLLDGVLSGNARHHAALLRAAHRRQSASANLNGAIKAIRDGDSPARVQELIEGARADLAAAQPEGAELATLTVADALLIEDTAIDWLAEGVLERDSLTVATAPPKQLKTFMAKQLALDGAVGRKAFGYLDVPAPFRTLWLDGEMGRGKLLRRLRRLVEGMELTEDELEQVEAGFRIIPQQGVQLTPEGDLDRVRRIVESHAPDLLVVDSLVGFAGGEENSGTDRRRFYNDVLAPIKAEFGLGVLMLAHPPLPSQHAHPDSKKRPRGSGDVVAACDRALFMYAPPGGVEDGTSASILDTYVSREGGDLEPTLLELVGVAGEALTWRASPYLPEGGIERHGKIWRCEQAILRRLEAEPAREMYRPALDKELEGQGFKPDTRKAAYKSLAVAGLVEIDRPRKGFGSGKWVVLKEAKP